MESRKNVKCNRTNSAVAIAAPTTESWNQTRAARSHQGIPNECNHLNTPNNAPMTKDTITATITNVTFTRSVSGCCLEFGGAAPSTNSPDCLNAEIKRCTNLVDIFPNKRGHRAPGRCHPSRAERRTQCRKAIHDAEIQRLRERHSRTHVAHRGSLSVPAQHAGYCDGRPALTPLDRTQSCLQRHWSNEDKW